MTLTPFYYKLINIVLMVSFILARLTDYATTYIMLLLGCKEGNWLVSFSIEKFGNLKGLVVATSPVIFLVGVVLYFVIRYDDESKQQFALFVLILITFYSIVITLGNISGLALVIHSVKT